MKFMDDWNKRDTQKQAGVQRASLPSAQKTTLKPPLLLTKEGVAMADGSGGMKLITPSTKQQTTPIVKPKAVQSAGRQLVNTGTMVSDTGSNKRQATPVTPRKSKAQQTVDNLPNIRAFGAGDYTGAGKLLERAAKTVKAGALSTAGSFAELAGQATPVTGEQHLGQFSGLGDLGRAVRENRETGEDINAITQRMETERRNRRAQQRQATFDSATRLFEKSAQAQAEAKEGAGTVGQFLVDMGVTGTQMLGDAVANLALPGSGLAMMGMRSYGQAANEARQQGKSEEQQFLAGLKSAGIETFTEKMFGAFSKIYGKAGADELVEKLVTKLTKNRTGQALLTWIVNGAGEGVEEVTSDVLNPLADRLLRLDNGGDLFTTEDVAQMGYDFLLGAAMGLVGGAGQLGRGMKQGRAQTAEDAYYDDLRRNGLFSGAGAANARRASDAMERAMPAEYARIPRLVDANGMDAQQRTAWLGALEQMPQAQRNQFETAAQIAKRFGATVQARTMQEGVQGSYQDGVISIDPAATDPVRQVLVHELTHHMESSGLYGKFSDAAMRFVAEDMGADVDTLRRAVMADYARAGVTLDEDGATREIVAKFAEEKLFTDEATVRRLLVQDRNLFQRIYDWLRDTVAKLQGTQEQRRLIDAQNLYEKALRQAEAGTQGRGTQLLYAGENAKTADLDALTRAAQMEADGTDARTIRRETGWFRGMDGKWRFEIDDSGMEYRRDGDARLMEESGYRRLQELTDKWARNAENRGEPLTAEEAAESERLEGEYYDRAWAEKYELADFLRHSDLFEAYPALRHTSVVFKETMPGVNGYYDKAMDAIVLSKDLVGSPERTLVHEIQHIIQSTEEFAGGSNPNYWKYKNKDGQGYVTDRRFVEAENRMNAAMDAMPPAVQETVRRVNRAKLAQDWDEVLRLEESLYNGPYADMYSAYTQADFDRRARTDYFKNANTLELYRNTAGEIEARDAANRRGYSAEQRRQLRPDMGNEATVFADGGVGYFAMSAEEQAGVREQLRKNSDRLNAMDVVGRANTRDYVRLDTGKAREKLVKELGRYGYTVNRPGLGEVQFSEREINNSLNYKEKSPAAEDARRTGFLVLRDVLKRGIEIDGHDKHKGRNYDTVTIAAPVEINGRRGNMAVVVKKTKGNRYKVHRILTPEGETFILPEMANAEMNTVGAVTNNSQSLGGSTPAINSASEFSIPTSGGNVNSNNLSDRKAAQLAVIEQSNPFNAALGAHTWIRGTEDILTYREAIDNFGGVDDVTPDFRAGDVQRALDSGYMTVYSSYPITHGTFVTPSYMEARNYAGDGHVYSKRVPLDDVAWLDEVQGQYTGHVGREQLSAGRSIEEMAGVDTGRTVEQATQADLDDLVRLYADQADPIGSREDRIRAAESMVTDHTVPERKSAGEKAREAWSYLYRKMVDAGHSVSKVSEAVNDPYLYQFYNQARASASAGVSMIADAQTDVNAQKVGESLNAIFSPIRQKGEDYYHEFQMYLFNLHNIDRMSLSQNKERAMLEARAALREFDTDHPEIRTDTEAQLRRLAEDPDPDTAALARQRMQLLRAVDRADAIKDKPVFGVDVTADVSRERVRRALQAHPEFEGYRQQVRRYIDNLMQYRVDSGLMTQENADFLKEFYPNYVPTLRITDGDAGAGRDRNTVRIGRTVGRAEGGSADLTPLHEALGKQTMKVVREGSKNRFGQRLLQDYLRVGEYHPVRRYIKEAQEFDSSEFNPDVLDNPDVEPMGKAKMFTIFRDGKMWELTVDDTLFDALKALSPDAAESNTLTKVIRASNNLFKSLVTGYNPTFLVRNTVRDLQTAGLYTRDGKAFLRNYPRALAQIKNNGEYWQMYKALGGSYSSVFDYATGTVKEPTSKAGKLMARLESLNMATEQAPRLAEFMSVLEKGGVNSETLADALYAAADVTVNFGRAGTLGKVLNANYVPFLNPGIQGFDKMIRRVTETKGGREWAKLIGRAAVLGIAPTLINSLLYHDDEEWDDLRDSDKDTNYMFKLKDGIWLKIPKGRELSLLGITADRVSDAVQGQDVDLIATLNTMGNQVAPANPLTSNIASALVDSALLDPDSPGRTWYGGDIENQRLQSYAPGQRYDSSTDVFSKAVGGALGISPKKLNYVLDQYTGVVGDFLLPILTPQAERGMFAKAFTTDAVTSNRVSGDFFDEADELTYAKNGGDETAAVVSRFWSKQQSACSDLWKEIREVEASDLSDKEKRQKTRELKAVVTGIQKNALAVEESYRTAAEKYLQQGMEAKDAYRAANKECFGAEYALQTYNKDVYERAKSAKANGVSYDDFYTYYFGTKAIKSTAEKSAATQKFEWLQSSGLDLTAQAEIYFADMASDTTLEQQAELESGAGITPEQFYQYKVISSGLSGRFEKLNAINTLELTNYQKDALYYMNDWSEKTHDKAPWVQGVSAEASANRLAAAVAHRESQPEQTPQWQQNLEDYLGIYEQRRKAAVAYIRGKQALESEDDDIYAQRRKAAVAYIRGRQSTSEQEDIYEQRRKAAVAYIRGKKG